MIIFETIFGSHLYGLSTENSDRDYKGIVLPSKREILLGRANYHKESNTGNYDTKNTKEDVDRSFYSLSYFIDLALKGDTVAIDSLHGSPDKWVTTSPIWEFIYNNRSKFYTTDMKAYVGYCKKHAMRYIDKSSRLGELERIINITKKYDEQQVVGDLILEESDIIKWIDFKDNRYLEVAGSKFQDNLKLHHLNKVLGQIYDQYGERTKLAKENKGVDWKALAHALRAGYQVRDIFLYGGFEYPLKESKILMQVKLGEIPFMKVEEELTQLLDEVNGLASKSSLPTEPDKKFWQDYICQIHEDIVNARIY